MDFFRSQDDARRSTRVLLVLFAAAVIALVAVTNLLVYWALGLSGAYAGYSLYHYGYVKSAFPPYDWTMLLMVSGGVLVFILAGSVYRMMSLSSGGEAVASMMDGQLLIDAGDSLEKRRLLNAVEEMAIASGVPVPPVYLIPDGSINAFAAGHSPGDAIIGITEGALENLNRDQLQGVIGHEFSHILNGDMRLNIRLVGVLYGIMVIALIGRILFIGNRYSIGYNYRTGRRNRGDMMILGLGLMMAGSLGKLFGGLIKAAVSRQREFLADASSVQFTRNPDGIAGALKRIGGHQPGSVLINPKSEEISHSFFAQGVSVGFVTLFATHPPLDERIRRIEPGWDGSYITTTEPDTTPELATSNASEATSKLAVVTAAATAGMAAGLDGDKVVGDIGNPGDAHIEHARNVIDAIPDELEKAAHEAWSARALIYLVLLDRDEAVRNRQIDHLSQSADLFVFSRFRDLLKHIEAITPHMRLPLVQLAMPALRQLSRDQYRKFRANVDVLIHEDNKVSLSEWALQRVVTKHLGEALEGKRNSPNAATLEQLRDAVARLISLLAYADRKSGVSPEVAFEKGRALLGLDIVLLPKQDLKLAGINAALDALTRLRPLRKPKLLKACVATITSGGMVLPVEQELLRAVAITLDCPMPPLVAH